MVRDLNKQILHQNNVIEELTRKLAISRDVLSDISNVDARQIIKNEWIIRKNTKVNIRDKSDGLEVDVEDEPSSNSKREKFDKYSL